MKINLLPKEERPLKQSQVRWEFLVGLLGALALGTILVFSLLEISAANRLQVAYDDALVREYLLQGQVQAVTTLREHVNALEARGSSYQELIVEIPESLGILPHLLDHSFRGLWIETVLWDANKVDLTGYTQNSMTLTNYINFLNENHTEVQLTSLDPVEGTGFLVFGIRVEGVGERVSAQLH
jgi:Tfp pilus assembly protein PilN